MHDMLDRAIERQRNSEIWDDYFPPLNLFNYPMSALDTQVGGTHYKNTAIQPLEYVYANKLDYCEGAIIKYITRWRKKNGVQDLEKIKHFVDLLIEMERKYNGLE